MQVHQPPDDLDVIERDMFATAMREYQFRSSTEREVLAEAMRAHQRARRAREQVEDIPGRFDGTRIPHPLLSHERAFRAQYLDLLSKLRIVH
jgi:hypothetical protein